MSFANLCTANNTIALIMAGPIAKDIADRFKIDPRRSASLLDIFSCFVQGIIPYAPDVDGRRTRACLPYRDHAISLLPVSIGSRRLIGDLIQLSEEMEQRYRGKKHNQCQHCSSHILPNLAGYGNAERTGNNIRKICDHRMPIMRRRRQYHTAKNLTPRTCSCETYRVDQCGAHTEAAGSGISSSVVLWERTSIRNTRNDNISGSSNCGSAATTGIKHNAASAAACTEACGLTRSSVRTCLRLGKKNARPQEETP